MARTGSERPGVGSRYAWVILTVTYIASFVAPMQQFKVPPLASWIMPAYGLSVETFGWLMSALAIIGIILALPTLFIVRKFGLKGTTLIAVACLAIGAFLCVVTQSLAVLIIGRMVEGIGLGLVGVSAPAAISVWFAPEKRGLPLGIWSTWMPLGMVLMFNLAPRIAQASSWQAVWWGCTLVAIVAFILFAIFYRLPNTEVQHEVVIEASVRECLATLKNKNVWFIGLSLFFFSFYMLGILNTYYNTYLESVWGMTAVAAAAFTSILTLIPLFTQPLVGWVNDRMQKRKATLVISFILMIFATGVAFTGRSVPLLLFFLIVAGIGGAVDGAAVRPLAPLVMPHTALGTTMAMVVLQICQNAGVAAGAPLFGAALGTWGWAKAGYGLLMPALVLGLVFALLIKERQHEKALEVSVDFG